MNCQNYDGLLYCTIDNKDAIVGNNTNIDNNAFVSYESSNIQFHERVSINQKTHPVTTIGRYAFRYNDKITTVHIHRFIVKLDSFCFDMCPNIINVTFDADSQLRYIQNSAFYYCRFTKIIIPRRVKHILTSALGGNNKLETLIYTPKAFVDTSMNIFKDGTKPKNIYVLNDYRGETFFGLNVTRIPNSQEKTCNMQRRRTHSLEYSIMILLLVQ